jgi:glucokinase
LNPYLPQLDVTNYPGSDEDRHVKRERLPTFLFPDNNTHFINDLESTCYGITALNEENVLGDYFKPLWLSSGEEKVAMRPIHYIVLAVGTGLGIACILSLGKGSRRMKYQVMPMEFGHTTVSLIGTHNMAFKEEFELVASLSQQLYKSKHMLEYEDIVSGRGLLATYNVLTANTPEAKKHVEPEDIATSALADPPCKYATEALLLHYRFLMRIAKNLAIGLQAKGLFLAGDNQVANNPFFEKYLDVMREEFLDHPKRSWIIDVDLFTQTKSFNINLRGALFVARSP